MDASQLQHERAVGDRLVAWLNTRYGRKFDFSGRGREAPDLLYSDGDRTLGVEVVGVYYDPAHAKMLWQNAREVPGASDNWLGKDPDQNLAQGIRTQIEKKCGKAYGPDCVLLVNVPPGLTTKEELGVLLERISIPQPCPFVGVFVAGTFPMSTSSVGGYHVFPLVDLPANKAHQADAGTLPGL